MKKAELFSGATKERHAFPDMSVGARTAVVILLLFLAVALVLGYLEWTSGGDAPMSAGAYVAIAFGAIFSILVGAGLMVLIFYSSRKGYDEPPRFVQEETKDDSNFHAR